VTWLIILLIPTFCLIVVAHMSLAIIDIALRVLALSVLFVGAALLTAFLCVEPGQRGGYVEPVTIGLTGGP
jgi:hypothetical protein